MGLSRNGWVSQQSTELYQDDKCYSLHLLVVLKLWVIVV